MKKILVGFLTLAVMLVVLPMFAAFEAHVINVTATIENALSVPVTPIKFGTVFPQEHLNKYLDVALSQSFMDQERVDNVEYIIRQKPKCAWSWQDEGGVWNIDESSTKTGHVKVGTDGKVTIDCGETPSLPSDLEQTDATWGVLPSLCEYISKHPDEVNGNDGSLDSFHKPWKIGDNPETEDIVETDFVVWTDTDGLLVNDSDTEDRWTIDLAVPCFGGHCAQDWESFVHKINPDADPDEYTQDITNQHKVFGCDLWVEVSGVNGSQEE